MKFKCLIAEDNIIERDALLFLLEKIDQVEVVASCENGLQAIQILQNETVDIVFTDVDMPEISGLSVLKCLKDPPVFILISAYVENAAQAYDLDAADFITKPVTAQRLLKAFGKAKEILQRKTPPPQGPSENGNEFLFARTSEGLTKLELSNIIYAESKGNFSVIHLQNGSSIMVLVGLKHLEEQLPALRFMRVHRNFIINWNQITLINKEEVTLAGKYNILIGEVYRKSFFDLVSASPQLERYPDKKNS